MNQKKVDDVMTPLEDVYMLPINTYLDFETVASIMKSGKHVFIDFIKFFEASFKSSFNFSIQYLRCSIHILQTEVEIYD